MSENRVGSVPRITAGFRRRRSYTEPLLYCPQCLSSNVRRSRREGWERFVPYLKFYRCRECRQRFRQRRAPFACCPRCGSSRVEAIHTRRLRGGLRHGRQSILVRALLRLLGARAYRCPTCRLHFLDLREHRANEKKSQASASSEPAQQGRSHETQAP